MRKKIGVLIAQADREYQRSFLEGFLTKAFALEYDVCVFSMFCSNQGTHARRIGESNIFNLVNYDIFDGIVILPYTMEMPGVANEIQHEVHEKFKGPVVVIDKENLYFPVVLTASIDEDKMTECGIRAARTIDSMINGMDIRPDKNPEDNILLTKLLQKQLNEKSSSVVMESEFMVVHDKLMDDLLSQTDERSFFNTVFSYVDQLRDYESLHLCFCKFFNRTGQEILTEGYTEDICRLIKCYGNRKGDSVDFEDRFNVSMLLPDLHKEIDKPRVFYFNPLYFDDRCFGYSVIAYEEVKVYSYIYRLWTRSISQGIEALRRSIALRNNYEFIKTNQIRDDLTGLYNYRGFIQKTMELKEEIADKGKYISIIALDISGMGIINDKFGRKTGDDAIRHMAKFIDMNIVRTDISARVGNDEFLIAVATDYLNENRAETIAKRINEELKHFNELCAKQYELAFCYGIKTEKFETERMLETVINMAINIKKYNKTKLAKINSNLDESQEELELRQCVADILDHNKLKYHFQPIVDAGTGEIFSYEALMRSNTNKTVSPLVILEQAEKLGRLDDVELATFKNVLTYVEKQRDEFGQRKVFLNSIPGCILVMEENEQMMKRLSKLSEKIVVELTEQNEASEREFEYKKNVLDMTGTQIAIDDYGTGYSNITNLLKYMPNYVKIDRSLITDIHNNPQKQHFVKDVIEFAHDNNFLALAEGVETSEELCEVIRMGVDLIQGFYIARPSENILDEINEQVKNEIVQYNQIEIGKISNKVYDAYGDISLTRLAMDKYAVIRVMENDITINGANGFLSNIRIVIEDNYEGTVTLSNVSLAGDRGISCIEIGENAKVTLNLVEENELRTGGIKVPQSSMLCVVGGGNLHIVLDYGRYFGIGNTNENYHGKLEFIQTGTISINGNGMNGIGIGSGYGGDISIKDGKYVVSLSGLEGIGIGSNFGGHNIHIKNCDMELLLKINKGVTLGSLEGKTGIKISDSSCRVHGAGNELCVIGSFNGQSDIKITNSNVNVNGRTNSDMVGIGSLKGRTGIDITKSIVEIKCRGPRAYGIGSFVLKSTFNITASDVVSKVSNQEEKDIAVLPENIHMDNGNYSFTHNDNVVYY